MSSGAQLYRLPTSTRDRRRTIAIFGLVAAIATAYASLALAASRLAYKTGYPSALGSPALHAFPRAIRVPSVAAVAIAVMYLVLKRRWAYLPAGLVGLAACALLTTYPVYPPEAYFHARRAFLAQPYSYLVQDATFWAGAGLAALLAAAGPVLGSFLTGLIRTGDLHGSSRLATPQDILAADFILDDPAAILSQSAALPLGNIVYRRGPRLVRAKGDVHALLFAPPGSGKTTALVIPTAQDWKGAAVILDVKGEIAQATAGHRQRLGSRILLLDPSRNHPSFVRYNPLISTRPHPYDVQDVNQLAQLLIPDREGADPFWGQSARTLLEGVILHVLYSEPEKTLAACYRFLCSPDLPLDQQFQRMLDTEHDPAGLHGWKHHPRVEMAARTFLDMPPQTRGGVVANALASLSPYSDPILAEATAVSDFSLGDLYLKKDDRPVTLYLVIDPNSLQRLKDHIRIVISQIAAALTRELPTEVPRHPLLLMLDEFPVFGKMSVIETAVAYFRGYGVQCYFVVQHLGQLLAAYGRHESISPNCSVHIAYAPADLETATALSKRSGSQTVRYERGSTSSQGMRNNVSVQEADSGRPLLMPDEVMRLGKNRALVLRTRTFPFVVAPTPYYQDPLRLAASRLPLPPSEPTCPDFGHWLNRTPAPVAPPPGKREKRTAAVVSLLKLPEAER